jgi:hypothetical protein
MTENPDKEMQEIRVREKFLSKTGFLQKESMRQRTTPIAEGKYPYQVH